MAHCLLSTKPPKLEPGWEAVVATALDIAGTEVVSIEGEREKLNCIAINHVQWNFDLVKIFLLTNLPTTQNGL